jgi:hypothetical protein
LLQAQTWCAEQHAGDARIKILLGQRQLDPLVPAHGNAIGTQAVIARVHAGGMRSEAGFAFGGQAANHSPGREPAATGAVHGAHTASQKQLSSVR